MTLKIQIIFNNLFEHFYTFTNFYMTGKLFHKTQHLYLIVRFSNDVFGTNICKSLCILVL